MPRGGSGRGTCQREERVARERHRVRLLHDGRELQHLRVHVERRERPGRDHDAAEPLEHGLDRDRRVEAAVAARPSTRQTVSVSVNVNVSATARVGSARVGARVCGATEMKERGRTRNGRSGSAPSRSRSRTARESARTLHGASARTGHRRTWASTSAGRTFLVRRHERREARDLLQRRVLVDPAQLERLDERLQALRAEPTAKVSGRSAVGAAQRGPSGRVRGEARLPERPALDVRDVF